MPICSQTGGGRVGVPAWSRAGTHHSFTKLSHLPPPVFFVFSPFSSPQSLLVVKSIKLSVSLTEPHHLAAVKAKQTR